MRLVDIGSVRAQLEGSPVLQDSLWSEEASTVTSMALAMFRARMGACGLRSQAEEAVSILQTEALVFALATGQGFDFLAAPMLEPRFMADELAQGLALMSSERAQALLFALEEGLDMEEVVNLTWTSSQWLMPATDLGAEILRSRARVRHIRLVYVFWEYLTPVIAAPLLQMRASIKTAFGVTWEDLRVHHRNLVWVDRQADATAIQNALKLT